MKAVFRIAVLSLSLLPVFASAQQPEPHPLAGTWKGTIAIGGVESEVRVELRIEGDVVTGPINGPAGEIFMQPGKVAPDGVSFTSPRLSSQDRDVLLVWTGQVTGENSLSFVVATEDLQDPSFELTLTRAVN